MKEFSKAFKRRDLENRVSREYFYFNRNAIKDLLLLENNSSPFNKRTFNALVFIKAGD